MTERMIEANGVELCTEPFGDLGDPPVLLVMGVGASMLWWEEGFCRLLADGGRSVIRYDHRDTGRSVTYEPGRPEYSGADLVADAVGVLDAYEIAAAHVSASRRAEPSHSCLRSAFPTACSHSSSSAPLLQLPGTAAFPRRPNASTTSWRRPRWTGRTKSP
ncbi:MAG TPA: hypothetical protein VNR59_03840 [Gaiellaceae bacterium]|nr:hypothetical protein [Gaiellaceae bacterium]